MYALYEVLFHLSNGVIWKDINIDLHYKRKMKTGRNGLFPPHLVRPTNQSTNQPTNQPTK
jgi:hypothetical protein